MLKVCIDTNIWISGIVFSGNPAEIVTSAFNRRFEVILSRIILEELERNLLNKFRFGVKNTRKFIRRILQISDLYEPTGSINIIPDKHTDNLVLETAVLGRAKYLVTGDYRHLLPLKQIRNVKIIDAASFVTVIQRR